MKKYAARRRVPADDPDGTEPLFYRLRALWREGNGTRKSRAARQGQPPRVKPIWARKSLSGALLSRSDQGGDIDLDLEARIEQRADRQESKECEQLGGGLWVSHGFYEYL